MQQALTAEKLYQDLRSMPVEERQKFFVILSTRAFPQEADHSHEEVFGHLEGAGFTSNEAAQYLEVSTSTFRRLLRKGQVVPSTSIGRSLLFDAAALKTLKRAMKLAKG